MKVTAETKANLFNLLHCLSRSEGKIESLRVALCSSPLFIPYEAYKFLANGSDCIRSKDIHYFLKSREYPVDKYSSYYLTKKYDGSNSNMITFKDFLEMILPKGNSELRFNVVQRTKEELESTRELPIEITETLGQLLYTEIRALEESEKLRGKLTVRIDFDPNQVFESLDTENKGYLDFEILRKYFGDKEANKLAHALIRSFNSKSGKVSFLEFMEGITPFETRTESKPLYMAVTEGFASKVHREKSKKESKKAGSKKAPKTRKITKQKTILPIPVTNERAESSIVNTKSFKIPEPKMPKENIQSIFEVLREEMKRESKIDSVKQKIALCEDISLEALHSIFSSKHSLAKWLKQFLSPKAYASELFDKINKGKELNNEDIADIFLPLHDNYAKLLLSKAPSEVTSKETAKLIVKLIELLVDEEPSKSIREKLPKDEDVIQELFEVIDWNKKGYFTAEEVALKCKGRC
eukprot:TRINITY_DN12697_c0_g1_i11.p1 TRINITY_DN12697_c0_g1~~TRINITY_DN12697_c0_g1_i11.p1  ORF type:complete len:468 (+),score=88.67 TRINITY_DN12697_c0_g1_i11:91-1494(+)